MRRVKVDVTIPYDSKRGQKLEVDSLLPRPSLTSNERLAANNWTLLGIDVSASQTAGLQ